MKYKQLGETNINASLIGLGITIFSNNLASIIITEFECWLWLHVKNCCIIFLSMSCLRLCSFSVVVNRLMRALSVSFERYASAPCSCLVSGAGHRLRRRPWVSANCRWRNLLSRLGVASRPRRLPP